MTRLFFPVSVPLLILVLLIGFSDTHAVGQLKTVSLAVEGMT
jgi:hypothetical protein